MSAKTLLTPSLSAFDVAMESGDSASNATTAIRLKTMGAITTAKSPLDGPVTLDFRFPKPNLTRPPLCATDAETTFGREVSNATLEELGDAAHLVPLRAGSPVTKDFN